MVLKLYTKLASRGFCSVGKGCIIKPILNTANSQYIVLGKNVNIGSFSWVSVSTDFGGHADQSSRRVRLQIGDNTSVGNNAFIVANNNIEIGKGVIIAPYVYISDHIHTFEDIHTPLHHQPLSSGGHVKIGDHVFVGIRAAVLPGVTIGERSVIGANTVVTKDVPSYSVVVGNPGRVVQRYNFDSREWESVTREGI